ncbi:hypothetical protein C7212DRAFT_345002 [Tuber magnatum]|uniref:Uncharacterized protein n=1 Tax=Tuber magnatum TaxID=42249 RepID=A0A317SLD9_9PEZI|nr:hypothetical protein C7212DRAFT_345002 [Tuber magnatum]
MHGNPLICVQISQLFSVVLVSGSTPTLPYKEKINRGMEYLSRLIPLSTESNNESIEKALEVLERASHTEEQADHERKDNKGTRRSSRSGQRLGNSGNESNDNEKEGEDDRWYNTAVPELLLGKDI